MDTLPLERNARLRLMLESHRRRLDIEIGERLREVRAESGDTHAADVLERVDQFESEALDYALVGLKADMVRRIDAALARLEAGAYGDCAVCGRQISPQRLQALPFAVRCLNCEKRNESKPTWIEGRRRPLLRDEASPLGAD